MHKFITVDDADRILGETFGDDAVEKKRLVRLANIWASNSACPCCCPPFHPEDEEKVEELKEAVCDIIGPIKAGSLFAGEERQVISERVKADTVEYQGAYSEGSRDISAGEQIALSALNALCSCNSYFSIPLIRSF